MSYIVVKTINGRRYRYRQRSWREGGKVRTESVYLGPADGGGHQSSKSKGKGPFRRLGKFIEANRLSPEDRVLANILTEDVLQRAAEIDRTKEGERQEALGRLHALYGLTLGPHDPVPVEKHQPSINYSTPAPAAQTEAATEEAAAETESPAADAAGPEAPSE